MTGERIDIFEDSRAKRFTARNAPANGVVTYRWQGERMILDHIEVAPALRGTGYSARFAAAVFDRLMSSTREIRLTCPYLRSVAGARPEWRARFGLEPGG